MEQTQTEKLMKKLKKSQILTQLIKFGSVGALSTILDMGTLNLLVIYANVNVYIAATAGFIVGTTNGYIWNRRWTFGIKENKGFAEKFAQFATVGGIGLLFNNGLLYLFIEYIHLNYNIAKIIAVFIIFFWNFTMNKIWTFRNVGRQK